MPSGAEFEIEIAGGNPVIVAVMPQGSEETSMNVVKWIDNHDVELRLESDDVIATLAAEGVRCFKSSKAKRSCPGSVFVRYTRTDEFSSGAYTFNDNDELYGLCMKFRKLGFAFWGIFKTETSPYDYMQHLQHTGQLRDPFVGIQAGYSTVQTIAPGQHWDYGHG